MGCVYLFVFLDYHETQSHMLEDGPLVQIIAKIFKVGVSFGNSKSLSNTQTKTMWYINVTVIVSPLNFMKWWQFSYGKSCSFSKSWVVPRRCWLV